MELTGSQQHKLTLTLRSIEHTELSVAKITRELREVTNRLSSYNRAAKYLMCLRDEDLQGQLEAKLNWVMLKPIEFIYNGIKVKCTYSGSWGAYGKSIKLSGKHYDMEQIIKENVIT